MYHQMINYRFKTVCPLYKVLQKYDKIRRNILKEIFCNNAERYKEV